MDRLILLRHAKAESEASSGDDFDRPLAARGRREAQAVGVQLAALGLKPDIALVSPALRTRETWELVEEAVPGAEVRFDPALYNAEAGKGFFYGAGGCSTCHSPTGDLAGIAGKYSAAVLQARFLYPQPRRTAASVSKS